MSAQFSVAKSTYTSAALWAVIVEDNGRVHVVRPSGADNVDQTRRIERLVERARKAPATPKDIILLASMNQSAVAFGTIQDADSYDDARTAAMEQLSAV